ncbi:unnamed protein product [Darwinula stevensoni]|uniref:Diacylglycerol O-acyltransferase n=1 Tax=Darwinula stevensoni TaxID=69355 RepID=A0A7R9AGE0_9CRUS|nr:unnamed protein product [Darwinula stevensoni]CAG0904126.1 unnamed protein product [Darwinula stevensoni]
MRGQRVRLISDLDVVFCSAYHKHLEPVTLTLVLDGHVDAGDLLQRLEVLASVEKLRMKVDRVLGYAVWREEDPFCFRDHLEFLDDAVVSSEGDLDRILQSSTREKFPEERSPWRILVIPFQGNARTALIFQVHHVISDAYGMVRAMLEPILDQAVPPESRRENATMNGWTRWTSFLAGILMFDTIENFTSPLPKNVRANLKVMAERTMEGVVSHSPGFPLKMLKDVRSQMACTVNDVFTAAVYHGLQARFRKGIMAVTLRRKSDGDLGNQSSQAWMTFDGIPSDPQKSLVRFQAMNRVAKEGLGVHSLAIGTRIFNGLLPVRLCKYLMYTTVEPDYMTSNVDLTYLGRGLSIRDHKILSAYFVSPALQMLGRGVMLTTFEDEARISVRANRDLVRGGRVEVEDALKRMLQWMQDARDLQGEIKCQG